MTRKEWMEKNLPAYVSNKARGGVIGCPNWYRELTRMDPGILVDWPCKTCHEEIPLHMCEACWNMELNVKEERRTKMISYSGKENNDDSSRIYGEKSSGCSGR